MEHCSVQCSHSAALFIFGRAAAWIKKHRAAASAAAAAAPLNQLIGQKVMRHRYAAVPGSNNDSRRSEGKDQDQGSASSTR